MRWFSRHPVWFAVVAAVLVCAHLACTLGLVPSAALVSRWMGSVYAERYPCEGCGCGCGSAAECWSHCCCHSEHERLVWAIRNGVRPPAGVRFTDEQWIAAANAAEAGSAHCVLCVEGIKAELKEGCGKPPALPEWSESAAVAAADACCGEHSGAADRACGRGDGCTKPASHDGAEGTWVGPTLSALSCKGISLHLTHWVPLCPVMGLCADVMPALSPVGMVEVWRDVAVSRGLDVDVPPPRAG